MVRGMVLWEEDEGRAGVEEAMSEEDEARKDPYYLLPSLVAGAKVVCVVLCVVVLGLCALLLFSL
jgi:hypothetical protein